MVLVTLVSLVRGQQLEGGLRQFTNRLLESIESSEDTNFVVSPYSLHSVFTGLLLGAGGESRSQLSQVLGVSGGFNTIDRYREITAGLAAGESKVQISNMMALAEGFKPKLNFSRALEQAFNTDVKVFDFENEGPESVREINNYVAARTNNKIKDLLKKDEVDPFTQLILINAVYFKGIWKNQFEPEDTFNTGFTSTEGLVDTPFMSMEASLRMLDDESNGVEILELPYSDPSKSMLIVLPKNGESSDNLSTRIAGLDLGQMRDLPQLDTVVTIPKFTLKYQTPLKKKFSRLGADRVFSSSADLSRISDLPLYVSDGIHQAFIEVNEEGTEAAAATAVQVGLRTARRRRQFFADRPFLFIVYDFTYNVSLFAGKVVNPSKPVLIQRKALLPLQEVADDAKVAETSTKSNKTCGKLLRDFPNALDNFKICRQVAEERKFLDWLRNNRELCAESQDLYENFMENECEQVWCNVAGNRKKDEWEDEKKREGCDVVVERNKQNCKNVENKIKAISYLNC